MPGTITMMIPFTQGYKEYVHRIAAGYEVYYAGDQIPPDDVLARTEVIMGNPSATVLAKCPALRWLQLRSAGADNYMQEGIIPKGVTLTNASGGYGVAISEYLLGVTLSLCKQLHLYRDQQQRHIWKPIQGIHSIAHANVLVVGLGDIGSHYAQKAHALGATVRGIKRNISDKPEYLDGLYTMDALDSLLPWADIVALCLPASNTTTGLFDSKRLAKMKKGAFLLNIGRGVLIDTDALIDALMSHHLGGAALDVVDPEPLPVDHPLWNLPNVIITPHSAGGDFFGIVYDATMAVCLSNLRQYIEGKPLRNIVK